MKKNSKEEKKIPVKQTKPLRVAAKKHIIEVNQQKGKKFKNAGKFESKNRGNTYKAVHELCVKYMRDRYSMIAEGVKDADIYKEIDKIKKEANRLHKQDPQCTQILINNKTLYDMYFKSEDGVSCEWKIVQEFPHLPKDKTTLYVRCWFPTSNVIVRVDVLRIAEFADDFEMVAILSFVQKNFNQVAYFDRDKTALLDKFATMAGDDPSRRNRSQNQRKEQIKLDEPASFTTGFLYSEYQVIEYCPDKLMLPNMCIPVQQVTYDETMLNDCLTLSVNQLLRHQFFVSREQVQRLWRQSQCWGQDRADIRKVEYGVSINAFKDFFVKDNLSYSIVEVDKFKGKESYAALKDFVKKNMKNSDKFREILILCSLVETDGSVVSHAGTFLRQQSGTGFVTIKFYDPLENDFYERGGKRLDYHKQFSRFDRIKVHTLQGW